MATPGTAARSRKAAERKAGADEPRAGASAPAFRVLGIDPGLASTGWGIVEIRGGRILHRAHGCISTKAGEPLGDRLEAIASGIQAVLDEWRPSTAGMESLFFWRNVTSALSVAEALGVIRLTLRRAGVELLDYSPTAIKQAVVGSSRAEKEQVQAMVKLLLGLDAVPKPDHAADALAAAICRYHSRDVTARVVPRRSIPKNPS